ncbi:MAG TPA: hypothetical protein DD473_09250 [Planctomycetaceae bacterium]|nr:hypothetical protein [Planctomycetaceae bacterium]
MLFLFCPEFASKLQHRDFMSAIESQCLFDFKIEQRSNLYLVGYLHVMGCEMECDEIGLRL